MDAEIGGTPSRSDDIPMEAVTDEEIDELGAGLPGADERDLFCAMRFQGSADLREQAICRYIHLVPPLARKFRDYHESREDLIQVGYVGLIKAVDGFDPILGVKFITYATHCILGEIRHYLRDKSQSIRRPRWLASLNRRVSEYMESFMQANRRLPSLGEIARALNIEEDGIVEILKMKSIISLNAMEDEKGGSVALRKIKSLRYETLRLPVEDRITLMNALERLKVLEQRIVYLFFYMDLTQTQIADRMGLSHKKVSRVLNKSLQKMKAFLTMDLWPERQGKK
jgi:RNA polymerase sigma-B factor